MTLAQNAADAVVTAWLAKYPHVPPTTLYDMATAAAPLIRAPLVARIAELETGLEQADQDVDSARFDRDYTDKLYGEVCGERDRLAAEVETLRGERDAALRLRDVKDQALNLLGGQVRTAEARVQRLEAALKDAYREGWYDYLHEGPTDQSRGSTWEKCWETSDSRALLPEETTK